MKLTTWVALIGALIAAGATAALYFLVGVGWTGLAIVLGVGLAGYVLASVGAAPTNRTTGFGEFMRGFLVGFNAALNAFLALALLELALPTGAAAATGAGLGALGLLATIGPVSRSEFYQGLLGWLTWLMPMSWLVVGLGVVFYLVCLLGHLFTLGKVPYLRVEDAAVDWATLTFFLKGGLISNLNPIDTAFNMGNFSFVDTKSGGWHKQHEAGHTLNLAAFGSVFHLVGAVDENVLRRGAGAFAERLAESNTGSGGSAIPMWD